MRSFPGFRRLLLVLALAWFSWPSALQAEEPPTRFRLIGLFAPERQQDLRDVLADVPELELVRLDYDAAEVTLRYDAPKLFPGSNPQKPPKPEEVIQRLNNLLVPAAHGSFRLAPRSTLAEEKLTRLEIDIGVLDCKACRYGAYRTVIQIDGVERATVSATPSRVTAWIDAQKTDRPALEAALKKAGVTVSSK